MRPNGNWIAALGMAVVMPWASAQAQDTAAYFRVVSPTTTVITAFSADGTMVWSNAAAGGTCLIQRTTILSGVSNWSDFARQTATRTRMASRLFDPNPPPGMVLIPAGINIGINPLAEGEAYNPYGSGSYPSNYSLTVTNAFYMDLTEITSAQWSEVRAWGLTNGYGDLAVGCWAFNQSFYKGSNHPVQRVEWYDCVKWCNARSEKEGRPVCYRRADGSIYRSGLDRDATCEMNVVGYRLPTIMEWEYAGRGGLEGKRFPWGNTIQHVVANYYSLFSSRPTYDTSATPWGEHPTYNTGGLPHTSPVGSFAPNGYGLYDMAGNLWEWCWDWVPGFVYTYHTLRGGSFQDDADLCRVGLVLYGHTWCGMRAVLAAGQPPDPSAPADVIGFTAISGDTQITLTWRNPRDDDFAGVRIQRKNGDYPIGWDDGTTVYSGNGNNAVDAGLINGTAFYYKAFSYNAATNFSAGSAATATPAPPPDTDAPADVSALTAAPGDGEITLTWQNSGDADLVGVRIQRKIGGYPLDWNDGMTIYNGSGTNTVDAGLTNDAACYYMAFSYDAAANYSGGSAAAALPQSRASADNYLIVDLSDGPLASSYPVSYLTEVPTGGWTDEYKTSKLVLRRIPAGTFIMGSPSGELGGYPDVETPHQVTLSQPFFIGVFEVTQRQWERVMGAWPSYFTNALCRDSRPVEMVSYNDARGSFAGAGWPETSNVDSDSFMGRLLAKTGMAFDLPTESEWEYAGRASTITSLNSGYNITNANSDAHLSEIALCTGGADAGPDASTSAGTAAVGSFPPNMWGLHDMHGNVYEWCLDWFGDYPGTAIDPKGRASAESYHRVMRGGCWYSYALNCRSAYRPFRTTDNTNYGIGFRVALPPGAHSPPDMTPPADVSTFSATPADGQVDLTWQNPSDPDFAGALIQRKTDSYPSDRFDGTTVYNGNAAHAVDAGLTNGTTYFYKAFNGGSGWTGADDASVATAKVGSYRPNAWGLYDMHGNVWEWCLDWYAVYLYPDGAVTDPKGPSSSAMGRVYRGGSWHTHADECRIANRKYQGAAFRTTDLGFRAAVPLDQ